MTIIDSSVTAMLELLAETAPFLGPAVLPSNLRIHRLEDICVNEKQSVQLYDFMKSKNISGEVNFVTSVDFGARKVNLSLRECSDSVDGQLTRLEDMLRLLVLGSTEEVELLRDRFLERNINRTSGLSSSSITSCFEECYQVAEALKVILSNTPGLIVELYGNKLPLSEKDDLYEILSRSNMKKTRTSSPTSSLNSSDEDEDDDNDKQKAKKRRRKKKQKS